MGKPTAYDPGKRLRPLLASYAQQATDKSIADHTHELEDIQGLDGDHGDIDVANNGQDWVIDNNAVTYAKIQDVSAASRLLGRGSLNGAGDPEEILLGEHLKMNGTMLNVISSTEEEWLFSTSTVMAAPGNGKFRTNTVLFADSDKIAIARLANDNTDMYNTLQAVLVDDLISIQDKSNANNWVRYRVTGPPLDNSTWWYYPIEFIDGGGSSPTNNSPALIRFTANGAGGAEPPATQNLFERVAVAGQSDVIADSPTDVLTFIAGANVVITTNPSADSIMISSTGGGGPVISGGNFNLDDGNATGGGIQFMFDDGGA